MFEKVKFEKLELLDLKYNKISDINVLDKSNFKELRKIYLAFNNISDIKVFEKFKFKKLELLSLKGNKILDNEIITKLKSKIKVLYNKNEINANFKLNQRDNKEIPIDDLIFDYKCNNCELNPILCKLFYCDKCQYYLCQDCLKKGVFHEHNLLVIKSKEELRKIKDKENEELFKNRLEIEKIKEQGLEKYPRIYDNIFNNYNYLNNNSNNPSNYPINATNNYKSNSTIYLGSELKCKKKGDKLFYYIKK